MEATDSLKSALLRTQRPWVPSAVKIHVVDVVKALAIEEAELTSTPSLEHEPATQFSVRPFNDSSHGPPFLPHFNT
jgi:hypothetical protein